MVLHGSWCLMFVAIETVSAMGPGSVDVGGENVRQCEPHARPMSVCVCVLSVCVCVCVYASRTTKHTGPHTLEHNQLVSNSGRGHS